MISATSLYSIFEVIVLEVSNYLNDYLIVLVSVSHIISFRCVDHDASKTAHDRVETCH